jgi:hypothetical protein
MNETAKTPGPGEMRTFGLMFGTVLATLFGILIPLFRHGLEFPLWPLWPWLAAMVPALWALAHPASLRLLYVPWMKFAAVAQWVNTRIIMLLLFYLVILPIGLLLRLFGKDAMRRRFQETAASYRVEAEQHDREHMEKPY